MRLVEEADQLRDLVGDGDTRLGDGMHCQHSGGAKVEQMDEAGPAQRDVGHFSLVFFASHFAGGGRSIVASAG
jgi:hypothetical protein